MIDNAYEKEVVMEGTLLTFAPRGAVEGQMFSRFRSVCDKAIRLGVVDRVLLNFDGVQKISNDVRKEFAGWLATFTKGKIAIAGSSASIKQTIDFLVPEKNTNVRAMNDQKKAIEWLTS